MSLARMTAGAGYRYLLKHTVTGDAPRTAGTSLVDYYAVSGHPPGRWVGSGLPGLGSGDGRDLTAGTVVGEQGMARLFGAGRDPVTDDPLGRPHPSYCPAAERTAARAALLPFDLDEATRAEAVGRIEAQEQARPVRSAVAGYDLTFTVPKSVSVLWALGEDDVRAAVERAHRDSVAAVLELIEERFLHTRTGTGSPVQVPARGAIALAFEHWDTRAGDPNLHAHLVIANKVQGPDGQWRAVDGRALYASAVACSEIYDTVLADALAKRLPVRFGYRNRGPRRTPAYEIEGIADSLLSAFSARSDAIRPHLQDLVATFVDTHGRDPDRVEVLRLRQRATLATRPDKRVVPLAELRSGWRATAETVCGQPVHRIVREALSSTDARPASMPATGVADLPTSSVDRYADAVVAAVANRRATWTKNNLLAEAARATRDLRRSDPGARIALLDRVVTAALERCVALDPPGAGSLRYAHPDARPMPAEESVYTTWAVLAAEARLLSAHADTTAPSTDAAPIHAAAARPMPGAPKFSPDQATAAATIADSKRRVDLLLGPAGTGKTRTLFALRAAWEREHGSGSVIGLAPSATAAAQLAASLRIGADTLAKWHHQSDPDTAVGNPWRLRTAQLVLVDEAAMATTAQLDALVAQAATAGAKVVLVGDHHQLGAVEAGGAFALLAGEGHAVELDRLHRFTEHWEAEASRALRVGRPEALDAYATHGRIDDGPTEVMIEAAYRAWAADTAAGRNSLLLAHDRDTVATLNRRARTDRVRAGIVDPTRQVALADGIQAGPGDLVTTRRNNRRLVRQDGEHVRNGDRWHVVLTLPDGSMDVTCSRPAEGLSHPARPIRLPADYVREHVELGYASTVHSAQGATADTAHLVASAGLTREAFCVAMTRGRDRNHAYVPTEHQGEAGQPDLTVRQILEQILDRQGAAVSATAVLRQRWTPPRTATAEGWRTPAAAGDDRLGYGPPAGDDHRRGPRPAASRPHREAPTRGGP
ncbi:MAG: MobF family relaxase [Sporichthyaceae bacterium]